MSNEVPAPNWHDDNPWADSLVYVPVEELAALLSGGTIGLPGGGSAEVTPEFNLAHWSRHGNALDAYLLPRGGHAGIRFGSAPESYLSPHVGDRAGFDALVERWRDAQPTAAPGGP